MAREFHQYQASAETRSFSCGTKELDEFLTLDEAGRFETERLGRTWLLREDGILVGYVTLSNAALKREHVPGGKDGTSPLMVGKIPVDQIPSILIGKLAVASAFQRGGRGGWILDMVIGLAIRQARMTGIRLLIVDSKPGRAEKLYQDHDFVKADRPGRHTPTYFFDLGAIKEGRSRKRGTFSRLIDAFKRWPGGRKE